MKNIEMAIDYIYRAKRCLKEAEMALKDLDAPGVIRRSQEALELSVKAILRALTIEYPRIHDVSDVLLQYSSKLPPELRGNINDLAELVSQLASIRGPAFYGYEREGVPPSKAFKINFAEKIYFKVEKWVKLIIYVFEKYFKVKLNS